MAESGGIRPTDKTRRNETVIKSSLQSPIYQAVRATHEELRDGQRTFYELCVFLWSFSIKSAKEALASEWICDHLSYWTLLSLKIWRLNVNISINVITEQVFFPSLKWRQKPINHLVASTHCQIEDAISWVIDWRRLW